MTILFGQDSYNLYAEIHQNDYNQLIHGLFMPGVAYGIFLGLPAIFNQKGMVAHKLQYAIYLAYALYYVTFDHMGALFSVLLYYPFMWLASNEYKTMYDRKKLIIKAIFVMFVSLVIQEGIGHTFFEDTNSHLEDLPNSILIAPLFGARSFFNCMVGLYNMWSQQIFHLVGLMYVIITLYIYIESIPKEFGKL